VLLKIYALKALVKSFLPKMNTHQRTRLTSLLKILVKILAIGEIAEDLNTSDTDKAHLRLAAAKGVLRLARRWDSQIPSDVVFMVVSTIQDQAAHVRLDLLRKIHQYIKDRSLHLKYASAYALGAVDKVDEIALEARSYLTEFVADYHKEAHKTVNGQAEKDSVTTSPEYALVYLVYILALHPQYPKASGDVQPDPDAYKPFFRELAFFLHALIHQVPDSKNELGKKDDGDNVPLILAILRTIKGYESARPELKSETLYAVCDIAIMIVKDIAQKKKLGETYSGVIPLPADIFKAIEPKATETKISVAKVAEMKAADAEEIVPKGAETEVPEAKAAETEVPDVKASEVEAPVEKDAELDVPEVKAAEVEAPPAKDVESEVPETKASEAEAPEPDAAVEKAVEKVEKAVEIAVEKVEKAVEKQNEVEVKASEPDAAEAEAKVPEPSVSESKAAEEPKTAEESKAAEPNETKVSEHVDVKVPDSDEPMVEADQSKAPESDEPMAEANETKAAEVDEPMAEADETKAVESDEPMVEATETKATESDTPTTEADESKAPESEVKTLPEPTESKAVEPNGVTVTESKEAVGAEPIESSVAEPVVSQAADTNGTKALEPNDTASKDSESVPATPPPVGGDEKTEVPDENKPAEESSKVDGSHLPPCFKDKDILARFKLETPLKDNKVSSPRGRKRGKRVDNGEIASEAEVGLEQGEPTPKKGKFDDEKPAKRAASTGGTGVIIKGPSRGGRKSVDKTDSGKKTGKKSELEKEPEEEVDEMTPAKRKRGRPKVPGKQDDEMSGDEVAGPSSETTPTTSTKKGKAAVSEKPSTTDSGKRKSGRPTKSKSEEEEKSAQKKDKAAAVSTPVKSATKKTPGEKSPAWKNEGERGGDESLVGSGIKVWWPLDKKFYKGEIVEYDSKKKKHKILYDDGEEEILNLAKERWELTGKQGKSSTKKKTPTAAATPTLSGTKYPEPKRLKVTSRTPPSQKDESGKPSDTSEKVASTKSSKPTSASKAAKESEKTPKASKPISAKEQAANAFAFDEVDEPAAKKQKTSSTGKASAGKQGKAEKAMSTSKDSGTESAKETSGEKPAKGKAAGTAEDNEPLDNWRTRSVKKSSRSVPASK
jgi:sister-chromatid-cohesion protein PDS5